MVIGRRHDVPVLNRRLYLPEDVEHVAASEGKLHPAAGIDYFAIAENIYPWHRIPDLVIGRPRYDNFLVMTASLHNMGVVDATETAVALHQSDIEGSRSGHRHSDSNYNRDVIKRYAARRRGCLRTTCTKYITKLTTEIVRTSNATSQSERRIERNIVVVLRSNSRQ